MRANPRSHSGFAPSTSLRCLALKFAVGAVVVAAADARSWVPAAETMKPVAALPAHVAGQFEHLTACQQTADGVYFVFDRRAHSVYTAPPHLDKATKLIEIGTEQGRVIDPTAFDLGPDGTFAVADAPHGRPRIQVFTTSGSTLAGFFLPGRAAPRITLRNVVMDGMAAIEYVGSSILVSQPELDALVSEYAANGRPLKTFGALRRTGHESDRELHLALNTGIIVANPAGGYYFVFFAGVPAFRKYDSNGKLMFERHLEGVELDTFIQDLPTTWKRRRTEEGEFPIVPPTVYAAAADKTGRLWVSLAVGVTYIYDSNGEKRRTIQFHAAGPLAPTGMSFTPAGRLLVTPGCYGFDPR